MTYWLYKTIIEDDSEREPQLALQSTINWARSLAHEVVAEHGSSVRAQYDACSEIFRGNTQGNGVNLGARAVFEPLFYSLIGALSVTSMAEDRRLTERPWTFPAVIVSWYYAAYNSMRSMLAALGIDVPDKHAGVAKSVGASLRSKLPHPFDMRARWERNEDFSKELPRYPGVGSRDLTTAFQESRKCAQEMILGYLSGTRKREVDLLKDKLKERHGFASFLSKDARAARDAALQHCEYNFMHCAFRYRGKANYRDAIYIAYGSRMIPHATEFVHALETSSQFMFGCALALARHRLGQAHAAEFLADIGLHLRGAEVAVSSELFWKDLS